MPEQEPFKVGDKVRLLGGIDAWVIVAIDFVKERVRIQRVFDKAEYGVDLNHIERLPKFLDFK